MPNSLLSTASRLQLRIDRRGEDLVQRLLQDFARALAVDRHVLVCRRESRRWSRKACPAGGRTPRRSCGRRCRAGPRSGGCPRRDGPSVKPSAAFGCEKNVELKSNPMPFSAAQSIQRWKCSGAMSVRSTFLPPCSRYIAWMLKRCLPGMRLIALSASARSSSAFRARPG